MSSIYIIELTVTIYKLKTIITKDFQLPVFSVINHQEKHLWICLEYKAKQNKGILKTRIKDIFDLKYNECGGWMTCQWAEKLTQIKQLLYININISISTLSWQKTVNMKPSKRLDNLLPKCKRTMFIMRFGSRK